MRTKNGFIPRVRIVLNIFSATFLALTATAATQFTNEFWISTSTNTADLGTLSDPYNGSTQAKFDSHMSTNPPYSAIHILAGTYQTLGSSGGFVLKAGQKILGSGIGVTTLQLSSSATNGSYIFGTGSSQTNIEVSDLTLNCNGTGGVNNFNGICLSGGQDAIRRVQVINTSATLSGYGLVAVGISIGQGSGSGLWEGDIIEECEVSQFTGGSAINAISFSPNPSGPMISGGIIRNNRVFLGSPVYPNNGIILSSTANSLIEQNYINGAFFGLVSVGDGITNLLVAHNNFKNCEEGVAISSTIAANLTFAYNNIEFTNNGANIPVGFAFTTTGSPFSNLAIVGNNVRFGNAAAGSLFIWATNVTGLIANNNTIDPALTNQFLASCSNINLYDNFDLAGNFITNMNQVEPPNGLVRTTVNGTPYTVAYTDRYIGVKTTGATTINLPSAVGYPGKEFIIMKEVNNANNVTITPAGTEKINGANNLVMSAGYANREVVSDGTNWFAR